jgi:excisionase family DNA binding protein
MTEDNTEYCGTTFASKLLGVSVGTIQNLVNANVLTAWKTRGGHRRISVQSILDYKKSVLTVSDFSFQANKQMNVVFVDDDENTRSMFEAHFDRWHLPIDFVTYSSAIDALMDLPDLNPMVLLTDLNMSDMDGFKLIKKIREHKLFVDLPIIAITGMSEKEIDLRGGLSKDVLILDKPLDMDWLKGFMEGVVLLKKS